MQTYRKEWEVRKGWGTKLKVFQSWWRCMFPCLKGVIGEGRKESNCIQIVLSPLASSHWQVWLSVPAAFVSPLPGNCGPYIHTPRSNLTQYCVIGSSREWGETGIECELPLIPTAGRPSQTEAEVTGRELAPCLWMQRQVCTQNEEVIFSADRYSLTAKRGSRGKPGSRLGQGRGQRFWKEMVNSGV